MENKVEFLKRMSEAIEKQEQTIALFKTMTNPIALDDAIGRASRMDAINNKSVNEAALRKAENKLKQLNRVLESVHDDDFGMCARCKQPIPEGRLLIRPESRLCVKCAF